MRLNHSNWLKLKKEAHEYTINQALIHKPTPLFQSKEGKNSEEGFLKV